MHRSVLSNRIGPVCPDGNDNPGTAIVSWDHIQIIGNPSPVGAPPDIFFCGGRPFPRVWFWGGGRRLGNSFDQHQKNWF